MALDVRGLPVRDAAGLGVAVSGGRDSVGLLTHLLAQRDLLPPLVILHVNHRMQASSDESETFVCDLARRKNLPCHVEVLEDPVPRGESQARQRRYAALESLAREAGCDHIAVAHHQTDQTETRLHNLFRGCSPAGLEGMVFKRPLSPGMTLCRPALRMTAEELHAGITDWIEDPTNASGTSPRHVLRNQALPILEDLVPRDLHRSLETTARLAREDDEALQALVPASSALGVDSARDLPSAILRRWLRREAPLDANQVDRGIEALSRGRTADLGRGVRLRIHDGVASLEKRPVQ